MRMFFLIFLLLGLSLTGCSSTPDRVHRLDVTLIGYEKALRWGHWESVVGYVKPGKPLNNALIERFGEVNIGGYNRLSRIISDDGQLAKLTVAIDYIDKNSMKVRKLTDQQEWEYDQQSGRWLLVSSLPYFK